MNPNFAVILRTLNAALEHVPPETRSLLTEAVQPHLRAVAEALKTLTPTAEEAPGSPKG